MAPLSIRDIPDAILDEGDHGLQVDWYRVHTHVIEADIENLEVTYVELAREWLESLVAAWGDDFRLIESENFFLATSRNERIASDLLRVGEKTYETMTTQLPDLAAKCGAGHFVCLVADTQDRYYDYLSRFYPPGEYGSSGGVCLREGYRHFVVNHSEPDAQQFVMVHELTHELLFARGMPGWLEEGLTQLTEESILGYAYSDLELTREEADRHRRFWSEHGLREYWTGESFHWPDEGQRLSYMLSQVIVRNMLSQDRKKFLEFARRASSWDFGEHACRSVYDMSLRDWAAQFLGPGDWHVDLEKARARFVSSLHHIHEGDLEAARRDLETAASRAEDDPECLNSVAWVLATAPQDEIRDGDTAVRLAEKACELTEWEWEPVIDTLAAAHAECGDFDAAIEHGETAARLAPPDERAEHETRLELYRSRRPCREEIDDAP